MTKYTCDHCGKEITDHDDYVEYEIEFEGDEYKCDLCAKCKHTIVEKIEKELNEFIDLGRK